MTGKTMEYKLQNGSVVDDETLEAMAAEWESGQWEGHLENVVIGLPEQDADELVTVSFRLPKSRVRAIERVIDNTGLTKSEFYRRAIDRELAVSS